MVRQCATCFAVIIVAHDCGSVIWLLSKSVWVNHLWTGVFTYMPMKSKKQARHCQRHRSELICLATGLE